MELFREALLVVEALSVLLDDRKFSQALEVQEGLVEAIQVQVREHPVVQEATQVLVVQVDLA